MVDEGIHVLMVTLPPQGHINPMLRFAKHLISKGLHVTLATTEDARERFLKGNIVRENPKIDFEFFSDGLSLDMDREKHADLWLLYALPVKGRGNLSSLITNLANKGRKFSCIINQPFVPWVADVAADHGISCSMLFIQALSLYAIYYTYHEGLDSPLSIDNPKEVLEVPGLPLLGRRDLPTFILPSTPFHYWKTGFDFVKSLEKVKWVLANSFHKLEAKVIQSSSSFNRVLPIGPLLPPLLEEKEKRVVLEGSNSDSCLEWLDSRPPSSVIYVAFGSITTLESRQMENIAMALKNSNRPFVWVVRPPKKELENENGGLPVGFLEGTKERGLVVPWCCQEKVLNHPAVACFVSHCGWNSILEAVVAGVPVIAFPDWTDQPTNAKLVVDVFKIGVRMRTGEDDGVSQEEVARCIAEITEGPRAEEFKKRAMELKGEARKAVADGGSSDSNIDRFIREIIGLKEMQKSIPQKFEEPGSRTIGINELMKLKEEILKVVANGGSYDHFLSEITGKTEGLGEYVAGSQGELERCISEITEAVRM